MSIKISNREIGDGNPCFITFEAGPTHDGLESAKHLVKLAAEAGADAIKFQISDPDRLVADKKMPFSYEVLVDRKTGKTETVTEPLYDILCRRALTPDEWRELKQYSDSLGLVFFSTVGFEEDVQLLEELGCHSIKIASADVNHFPLIRRVARTGMNVQLDTGNATIGEVEEETGAQYPLIISGTVTDLSGRNLSGQTMEALWHSVRHAQPLAIGLNCSFGAEELRPHIEMLSRRAHALVSAYPNAGLPNEMGEYDETPETTAGYIAEWADEGMVNIVGGCCGTTPDHIRAIAGAVKGKPPRALPDPKPGLKLSGLEAITI